MPPQTTAVLRPETFLAEHGYPAQPRTIRSNDHELVTRCPRLYYLIRALGLVSAITPPSPDSAGTFYHQF